MSLDRYIAVCKPFSTTWQKFQTQNMAFVVSIVLCIFALLLIVPEMLYTFKMGQESNCICASSNLLKPF